MTTIKQIEDTLVALARSGATLAEIEASATGRAHSTIETVEPCSMTSQQLHESEDD